MCEVVHLADIVDGRVEDGEHREVVDDIFVLGQAEKVVEDNLTELKAKRACGLDRFRRGPARRESFPLGHLAAKMHRRLNLDSSQMREISQLEAVSTFPAIVVSVLDNSPQSGRVKRGGSFCGTNEEVLVPSSHRRVEQMRTPLWSLGLSYASSLRGRMRNVISTLHKCTELKPLQFSISNFQFPISNFQFPIAN
ncbi:unnamed protein product [Protopolystoma xenopodis]|uniref:Uncharacterized protein n=1 Tax=Protopolystoma xenopodis TaxID=117903 RepID=A0A3S5CPN5_9PLAT|nr:unnamed protein product [Protopolystoma xenopodis]